MAVLPPVAFGKSKTPATASAPSLFALMSRAVTPTSSPWTTTAPAAVSLPGV
jgi:hypothetical protein